MKRLAVIGAGGHGRVVAESAAAAGWTTVFYDDHVTGPVDGWSVGGKTNDALAAQCDGAIVAIGNNRVRLEWIARLRAANVTLATIVHPSALVSRSAVVGAGTFVAPGAIVGTGAVLGAGCIINTAASVDHDCSLGDVVHLSPGVHLSGEVTIGTASWLGTGCSVRNKINIGRDVVVGVGGVVVRDVEDGQTVVGVPARPLEKS